MGKNEDGSITKRLTLVQPGYRGANYKTTVQRMSSDGYKLVHEREEGTFLILRFEPDIPGPVADNLV